MVPDQIQGTAIGSYRGRRTGLIFANAVCMLLVCMLLPFASNQGFANDSSHTGVLKGLDLDGRLIRLGQSGDTKAVAVVFLSTHCPISNGYLPLLNDYASEFGEQGIELVGVISDPSVTRSDAKKHSADYRVEFPVLFDGSGELRLALSPTHTPLSLPTSLVRLVKHLVEFYRFSALNSGRET
ncbi:redoxin domain-containing protein, partial [Rhodopirellula bahusiensis]|uniref:redoxin domain-containing protein n=1 Tax=Rhodopirellula bahusiensis TaxID=2014065 RepID=UPI001E549465